MEGSTRSIYVTKTEILRKHVNRLGGKIGILPTPREESIDIDTEEDFRLAEGVARLCGGRLAMPQWIGS